MSIKIGLILHSKDNVATLLEDVEAEGLLINIVDKEGTLVDQLEALESIERGHKVALQDIGKNQEVLKYGEVIGKAVTLIRRGGWVHVHNLASCRGRGDLND